MDEEKKKALECIYCDRYEVCKFSNIIAQLEEIELESSKERVNLFASKNFPFLIGVHITCTKKKLRR